MLPQQFTRSIVTEEAAGAEKAHHSLVISRGVSTSAWLPILWTVSNTALASTCQRFLAGAPIGRHRDQFLILHGGHVDAVADHDRRRVPGRQRYFPHDILAGTDVGGQSQLARALPRAIGPRTRPVVRPTGRGQGSEETPTRRGLSFVSWKVVSLLRFGSGLSFDRRAGSR